MQNFTELLKLDAHTIKADLTFAEFKKIFPLSAKYKNEVYDGGKTDALSYFVAIGKYNPDGDEPPYMSTVNFSFKKWKADKAGNISRICLLKTVTKGNRHE